VVLVVGLEQMPKRDLGSHDQDLHLVLQGFSLTLEADSIRFLYVAGILIFVYYLILL
jgi:hypothetical protein